MLQNQKSIRVYIYVCMFYESQHVYVIYVKSIVFSLGSNVKVNCPIKIKIKSKSQLLDLVQRTQK